MLDFLSEKPIERVMLSGFSSASVSVFWLSVMTVFRWSLAGFSFSFSSKSARLNSFPNNGNSAFRIETAFSSKAMMPHSMKSTPRGNLQGSVLLRKKGSCPLRTSGTRSPCGSPTLSVTWTAMRRCRHGQWRCLCRCTTHTPPCRLKNQQKSRPCRIPFSENQCSSFYLPASGTGGKYGISHSLELLTKQLAAEQGVTEELKEKAPMQWLGMMNSIRSQAEEIILGELIFS